MRARLLLTLAMLVVTPAVLAGNFAECLLDNLPGVQNNPTTIAALNLCREQYPSEWSGVQQGSGRGLLSRFDSGSECTLEVGRDITVQQGAFLVAKSCKLLYDKPRDLLDELYPEGGAWNNYTPAPTR